MKNVKGLKKLRSAIERLSLLAEEVRSNLEEKREWWDNKSDRWRELEEGEEWNMHLANVEMLLDDIENLDTDSAFENLPVD